MLKPQEVSQLILIVRRAPLHNMEEAENVSRLLDKTISTLRQLLVESAAKADQLSILPSDEVKASDEPERGGP